MAAPELQPLALEAKSDAAILKYLPLPAEQVGGVVDTLSQAAAAELWPTRAAALAFSQVPLLSTFTSMNACSPFPVFRLTHD